MILSTTTIGVLAASGIGLTYKVGKKIYTEIKRDKGLEQMRHIWLSTLVYSKCWVGDTKQGTQKTFDLMEMKRIPNGVQAMSLIPYGMSLKDLESKKDKLEDALDALITIEKDRYKPQIWVKIINEEPRFEFEHIKTDLNHIWLGYKHDGTPLIIKLDESPHFIFGGGTGSGKTYAVACILTNLFLNNTSEKGKPLADFYLCQIAKADLKLFENVPHVTKVINDLKDITEKLEELLVIADKRCHKMAAKAITSVSQWNELYGKKDFMKRIYFVVDELAFFTSDKSDDPKIQELKDKCWMLMRKLGFAGRNSGLSIVGIVQRCTAGCLGGDGAFKSQLSRFTLKQNSEDESRYIIDKGDAARLKKREAIFSGYNYDYLVVPTLNNGFKDLKEYIPEIKIAEDFINKNNDEVAISQNNTFNKKQQVNYLTKVPEAEMTIITDEERGLAQKLRKSIKYIRENNLVEQHREEIKQELSKKEEVKYYQEKIYPNLTTDRDKAIVKFMENSNLGKYKAMTLDQIHKIFFYNPENPSSSYKMCSKRIKQLEDKSVFKSVVIKTNEKDRSGKYKTLKVYYIEKLGRPYNLHDLQAVNLYSELKLQGATDIKIEITPKLTVMATDFIPDALITCKINEKQKRFYFEAEDNHQTDNKKIKLYERLADTEKFELVMAKDGEHCTNIKVKSNKINIIKLDFSDYSGIEKFL